MARSIHTFSKLFSVRGSHHSTLTSTQHSLSPSDLLSLRLSFDITLPSAPSLSTLHAARYAWLVPGLARASSPPSHQHHQRNEQTHHHATPTLSTALLSTTPTIPGRHHWPNHHHHRYRRCPLHHPASHSFHRLPPIQQSPHSLYSECVYPIECYVTE